MAYDVAAIINAITMFNFIRRVRALFAVILTYSCVIIFSWSDALTKSKIV